MNECTSQTLRKQVGIPDAVGSEEGFGDVMVTEAVGLLLLLLL